MFPMIFPSRIFLLLAYVAWNTTNTCGNVSMQFSKEPLPQLPLWFYLINPLKTTNYPSWLKQWLTGTWAPRMREYTDTKASQQCSIGCHFFFLETRMILEWTTYKQNFRICLLPGRGDALRAGFPRRDFRKWWLHVPTCSYCSHLHAPLHYQRGKLRRLGNKTLFFSALKTSWASLASSPPAKPSLVLPHHLPSSITTSLSSITEGILKSNSLIKFLSFQATLILLEKTNKKKTVVSIPGSIFEQDCVGPAA